MKIKRFSFLAIAAAIAIIGLISIVTSSKNEDKDAGEHLSDYVSTLVGTLSDYSFSTGNTYPAVAMPWGMNFWTPQTGEDGDGWAYSYNAHTIKAFKHTHQPSPWINDYGAFTIMAMTGELQNETGEDMRRSWFSHKSEVAKPYYYKVYLADHDVTAEIAPTERASAMRFTFPESRKSRIVIDALKGGQILELETSDMAKNYVTGYTVQNSGGVPEGFKCWFVAQFDTSIRDGFVTHDTPNLADISFITQRGQQVNVIIASSFISIEQAWINLKEVEGRSFDEVKDAAQNRWDEVLGRIRVSGGSDDQYRTFYSCLYRSLLFPRKSYEIDAEGKPYHYSPYSGKVEPGFLYTDTGFWDTFRALFPLLNLAYPDINKEIQSALANIGRENQFLPEWSSPGHRDCMVGNNSASVVADAAVLGVNTNREDLEKLYETIVYGTENVHPSVRSSGRLGHEYYNKIGYIPYNVGINENVARTLEYAYNDWSILQLAKILERPQEEINKWASRAFNYKNVFDKETKLMRGRNEDGSFQTPFSPYKWGDAFTEGNAWHYTWSVFHDIQGLIELMGGDENFTAMLDSVFVVPPVYDDSYYGFRIHEITEMQVADMGNYAHGNQPAQHMLYLYNWSGAPWKGQKRIRETMERLYSATPDGYCGDEDNGQTSAWYVFSALGFYPVCPASGQYALGTPLFKKAVIGIPDGKSITIQAPGNGSKTPYVKSLKINGKTWSRNYIDIATLKNGATLRFRMSPTPEKSRGTESGDRPYSFSNEAAGSE